MLLPFFVAALQCALTRATPVDSPSLSIPVHDIRNGDMSVHESHPHYKLYTRWLESPIGSYIKRDPHAAFDKHDKIVSIDCHPKDSTCFFTSRLSFTDITETSDEIDRLKRALVTAQAEEHDSDEALPATLTGRSLDERWWDLTANKLLATTHYKTYHDLGEDDPVAGYQHYITWDLKCDTLDFVSSGMQLQAHKAFHTASNKVDGTLYATIIGDTDPATVHGVSISIVFMCGIFQNKCCMDHVYTSNCLGDDCGLIPPKKEPMECLAGKDVSNQKCDSGTGGWCTFHVTQYQKNEGPGPNTENYRFDLQLYDGEGAIVGDWELRSIPSGQTSALGTKPLLYTLLLKAPNVDDEPIVFRYGGSEWDTNDSTHCSMGVYDEGSRNGDCGFTCSQ